ncbi:contractile injection system protein, VgrG/Pvc8 family [Kiloniella laminariae]|uniref:Contractile injection system protein, VgrG/Pvc8 family n=1 Tax=Kiloniella laminariae TaxID=454162 RepID=A0ABT4LKS4_9PROT|nr:contractile injection system protein, VgrG/Pvc8 family [Kiloniella laminariae]MCZ4281690.1 contractile injection system protein, VgrG/Pvc8 family [Kiloniella laminariae]
MKPLYRITADQHDITGKIKDNLVNLTLTDKRNLEADQLDISFTDPTGKFALPRKGVKLRCWIGFQQSGLVYKGSYTADEISETGPPDVITIRARSANFTAGLKQERDLSFDGQSLGQILGAIAGANNLELAIEDKLKNTVIDHIDQTGESWANLITRLAGQYDALATIKDDKLLFIPVGHKTTVGGITLPGISLTREGSGRHSFMDADRESEFTGVKARWHDLNSGQSREELAGEEGSIKTLKKTFPTQAEAAAAAKSKWNEIGRAKRTMRFSRNPGLPELIPNLPVTLSGWRAEINAIKWISGDITHRIDSSGLSTAIDLEERV